MTLLAQRLEPVGLAELVQDAALLTRVDRKYLVRADAVDELLEDAPAGTRELEIDGLRTFAYRSTYLDTPDLAAYHLAGRGRRRRFKVRSRAYEDTGTCWLEVKVPGPRGTTAKERIEHPDPGRVPLGREARTFVDAALARGGVTGVRAADLEPVVVTSYRRRTLLLPDGSRVTIDLDLGWTDERACRGTRLHRPGLAIVETKSRSSPSAFDRLLWRRGHRPTTLSKFAVGLAALDPDLPPLKWARTLKEIR
ncbi:polyphosphate polymerase domain-containing protein [Aeromicrobium sp. Marseille-Q0843]|uniref:Polyphosphate polymerase domain-containing protein n=1 Tax=Aeromicrobium phoceense TaxID=2754045 RepID=A0A838XHH2_9ACTN|nr:polyphosphate polymerase domain-containing protein [Aeromicrobium phoceense]MBA4608401.1 polyphosphate polymerase domain-containing protein [Aeromicrobium phoceense]